MGSLDFIKILQLFQTGKIAGKPGQRQWTRISDRDSERSRAQSAAGFTMIELLVVIIIIGVLSAIAAPGWLAFTNRQRVNAVNDAALNALREAQREAKRTKVSYSVSFRTLETVSSPSNAVPQVAVYQQGTTPTNWKNLAENQDIKGIVSAWDKPHYCSEYCWYYLKRCPGSYICNSAVNNATNDYLRLSRTSINSTYRAKLGE